MTTDDIQTRRAHLVTLEEAAHALPFNQTLQENIAQIRYDLTKEEKHMIRDKKATALLARWSAFLKADPRTHTPEEMEDCVGDAVNATWEAGPIAALAPHLCEEFRAISKRLGDLNRVDKDAQAVAYRAAPLMFRLGCDFGDAVEAMDQEDMDSPEVQGALNLARGVWFVIATLAEDAAK